jgi:hypothetical protein
VSKESFYMCSNCDTDHDTAEEAIECCQCERCAELLAVISQVKKLQRLSVAGTEKPSMSHFIFKDTEWVRWDEIEELLK